MKAEGNVIFNDGSYFTSKGAYLRQLGRVAFNMALPGYGDLWLSAVQFLALTRALQKHDITYHLDRIC